MCDAFGVGTRRATCCSAVCNAFGVGTRRAAWCSVVSVALRLKRPRGCIRLSTSAPGGGLLSRAQPPSRRRALAASCEVMDHENEIMMRSIRPIGECTQLYTGHTKYTRVCGLASSSCVAA